MVSCLKSKAQVPSLTSFVFVEVTHHPITLRMGVRGFAREEAGAIQLSGRVDGK